MKYECISADGHIDLCWLPHDLFVSNASNAMKDRMPYVASGPDGPQWVTKGGLNLGLANGRGSSGALTGGGKYVPGREMRLDRIAATGLYTDGLEGRLRPTTPELRIQDQDRDGIQAEVLYGLHGAGNKMTDREASVEFYRIYNDWLADFCKHDRTRFVGLASIPSHDVNVAVEESRRVAKLGLGGLDISASWNMVPLWNPYWEPLWKAAAEINLPVHIHTITARPWEAPPDDMPQQFKVASRATFVASSQICLVDILASVIHSGALERYPSLRIVFGESGIGWVPYVLDRMDYEHAGRFRDLPIKMKPSEYWRRQCRATFQDDQIGAKLLDDLGVETAMWGSDFPHGDTVFPDSQEYISRQFGHLPAATRRKVTCENVGKFYGLM
jgi:predicted TIM-barrel fold metal-dependent hydrolase